MSRRIICAECAQKQGPQHPEDIAIGWKRRIVNGKAQKPAVHAITVHTDISTTVEDLPTLLCDNCGATINDGSPATAVTMWRGIEPANWESEYLQPL